MSLFFVDPDIAKAKTLNTEFYTDPEFFIEAKEKIFSNCWQVIGNTDLVKEPGECFPFTFLEDYLDEPLLLTRDKENNIHCLSNVCTHRGTILIHQA
jgi:choline monooxygenase